MSSKKNKINYALLTKNPIKHWKENPAGPEQKELERLFASNLIDLSDSPNSVRKKNPMFMEFSTRVFAVHFRKTKAKFGFFTKTNDVEKENIEDDLSKIPELGKENTPNLSFQLIDCNKQEDINIEFINPPVAVWMYTDHEKNCVFVYVAVPIISGSKDVHFNLSEDGMKVSINYGWPNTIFKPEELFYDEIHQASNTLSINHPKLHSLKSHLLNCGITDKSKPTGNIVVTLPIEVQREAETWKKIPVKKSDGTRIVLLEFKGYQQNIIIENADTRIIFD